MGYCLNCLDEPVFIAVSKPLLTEFGIHYSLESCDIYHLIEHRKVMEGALFDFISRLISPLPNYILWHCIFRPRTFSISLDRFEGKAIFFPCHGKAFRNVLRIYVYFHFEKAVFTKMDG